MSEATESAITYVPVDHLSAWCASERDRDSFVFQLQSHHLAALDQAVQNAKQNNKDAESLAG